MRGKSSIWERAGVLRGRREACGLEAPKKGRNVVSECVNSFAFHLWEQSLIGLLGLERP